MHNGGASTSWEKQPVGPSRQSRKPLQRDNLLGREALMTLWRVYAEDRRASTHTPPLASFCMACEFPHNGSTCSTANLPIGKARRAAYSHATATHISNCLPIAILAKQEARDMGVYCCTEMSHNDVTRLFCLLRVYHVYYCYSNNRGRDDAIYAMKMHI